MKMQISIRSLLLLTLIVAVSIVVLRSRPDEFIRVVFLSKELVRVNGVEINQEDLTNRIKSEQRWRSLWFQDSKIAVQIPRHFVEESLANAFSRGPIIRSPKRTKPTNIRVSIRLSKLDEFLAENNLDNISEIKIGGISMSTESQD